MNIAIFGFYNALNTGDDRLQYCLTRALRQDQGNALCFLPHYIEPDAAYLRSFDWILIGGGGLVLERVGIWHGMRRWIGKSQFKISRSPRRVKVGVLGLGIKHLPDGLDGELEDLLDKAEFFHVRDHHSKELLGNDERVQVSPDLAWMFPYQTDVEPPSNTIAFNFADGDEKLDAKPWVEALQAEQVRPFPFYFTKARDLGLLRSFYGDAVPDEWTLEPLIQSEILVGSRYHAVTFAMQLRRPLIAINYDKKIWSLLKDADLLDCLLEPDQSDQLAAKLDWVRENKTSLIARIDHYARAQEAAGAGLLEFIHTRIR